MIFRHERNDEINPVVGEPYVKISCYFDWKKKLIPQDLNVSNQFLDQLYIRDEIVVDNSSFTVLLLNSEGRTVLLRCPNRRVSAWFFFL